MMRKLLGFLIFSSLSAVAGAQATNAVPSYHRPADAAEMAGFWKMVKWTAYFQVEEKEKTTPFFRDYQWYLFLEDGSLKSLSSTHDSSPKEAYEALQKAPSVIHFKVEDNLLRLTRTDKPETRETWSCSLITEERKDGEKTPVLRKGDVLMSLLNKQGKVVYVRHLRKADPNSTEAPKPPEKSKVEEPNS